MKRIAIVLAAFLIQSTLSIAQSNNSRPKPSSFVPHSQTNTHVYGAPIGPAVVGHSKASHHKQAPKKRSSSRQKKG